MKNSSLPRILAALVLALAGALTTTAYDFEVDGIYYNKNSNGTSVSVTYGSNEYNGSITIPSQVNYSATTYSVTSIGADAFRGCSGLTSVTIIGNSVTKIGDSAFRDCTCLTSVTIPNSVITIDYDAFAFCYGLTSVTIPNSVTEINMCAFMGCSGLEQVLVDSGNSKYDSRNNCNAIIETSTKTLICGCKNTTIPNSVKKIGYGAFSHCSGLTSMTIPNSVTVIVGAAFHGCTGLTSVTIPNSVTYIGQNAFSGCSGLTSIYSNAEVPPTCSYSVFDGIDKSICKLYVPDGRVSAYQQAYGWKDFLYIMGNEDVTIDGGVEVSVDGGVLHCGGVNTEVYTLSGALVYSGCGDVELTAGAYIVVANGRATKVVVK